MTNNLTRDASGPASFVPPSGITGDVFSLARPPVVAPQQGQLNGARYAVNPVGKEYPNLYHWMLEFYDFRGPMRQQGRFDLVHNANAANSADLRFEGVACHPFLTKASATPAASHSSDSQTIYSTQFLGQAVWTIPNSTDVVLVGETSATDSTPFGFTYSHPTWFVSGLSAITLNTTDYLAVQYTGHPTDLLSDLAHPAPTVSGTAMNAATAGCYGMIQTTLPDRPIVMHNGATFSTLTSTTALGAAPTVATSINSIGGWAVGLLGLGGGPLRCWWNIPRRTGVTVPGGGGVFTALNGTYDGMIVSTDQYGTNVVEHTVPYSKVVHTAIVRGGLVYGDFDGLSFDNGRSIKPLNIFRDEFADSNRVLKVTGVWTPDKQELFAEVNECATSGTAVTRRTIRRYDFDLDHWSQVAVYSNAAATYVGIESYIGAGALPYSPLTRNLHNAYMYGADLSWLRKFEPPSGVNPWYFRKTSGAIAGTGKEYEPVASVQTVDMGIPGLDGYALVPTWAVGPPMENIRAGGSGAYVTIQVGTETVRFNDNEEYNRYPVARFSGNSRLNRITAVITGHQQSGGTDPTRYSTNLLPFWVGGYCLKDDPDVPGNWRGWKR